MTRLIISLLLLPVFCMGQKLDVEFDAYLYRHVDTCHYEKITWGTIPRAKGGGKLFVIIIDSDTFELDLRYVSRGRRSTHLDGYMPGTLARYFVDLYIERDYFVVVVIDDDERVVHQLSTIPCLECRKK